MSAVRSKQKAVEGRRERTVLGLLSLPYRTSKTGFKPFSASCFLPMACLKSNLCPALLDHPAAPCLQSVASWV